MDHLLLTSHFVTDHWLQLSYCFYQSCYGVTIFHEKFKCQLIQTSATYVEADNAILDFNARPKYEADAERLCKNRKITS